MKTVPGRSRVAFPSLGLVVELYLMSQDINVVSHVPRRCSNILPVLSILKLHFSLQISLLDHFHLEKETGKERGSGKGWKVLRAAHPWMGMEQSRTFKGSSVDRSG